MQYAEVLMAVRKINGCTFAALDAVTEERGNIIRTTRNEQVLLFSGGGSDKSAYEAMVRRRLTALGRPADDFKVGKLPWGEHVGDTPLIYHRDRYYLQTILLRTPDLTYTCRGVVIEPPPRWNIKQGLPLDKQVVVQTYALDNIQSLRLMGEVIT